eukprot:1133377-Rhodomonas_salina.6
MPNCKSSLMQKKPFCARMRQEEAGLPVSPSTGIGHVEVISSCLRRELLASDLDIQALKVRRRMANTMRSCSPCSHIYWLQVTNMMRACVSELRAL